MIAYCLDSLGDDPSFLIGGEVAQLGGNARAGEGWLVVEGDESDGTVFSLPADIAVVTNVDLDHHTEFSSTAELEERFEAWAADRRRARRRGARHRWSSSGLRCRACNRINAACALALSRRVRARRVQGDAEFRGAGRLRVRRRS
jgi:hypothetical protein